MVILTAFIWACIAESYALAARRGLSTLPFVAVTASTASILTAVLTVRWNLLPNWREALPLIAWIALAGLLGQVSMMLNGKAMKAAPTRSIATWTLFQVAMVVPFLAATTSGRERAAWYQWLALPIILAAMAMLAPKRSSDARLDGETYRQWLGLLMGAFLCSGVSQTLMQEVSLMGLRDKLNLRAPVSLGAGGLFLWSMVGLTGERLVVMHWWLGALTGVLVALANLAMFAALDNMSATGRTYLVFPIAVGGSILLYAAFQFLAHGEAYDRRKVAGLACGLVGVALLALKPG